MQITKEQLYSLYITQNLSRLEVAQKLNKKESTIKAWLIKFNIKKGSKLHVLNIQRACLKKYGVKNGGGVPEVLERIKQTNRERFGCDWGLSTKGIQQKRYETLAKEGIVNVFQRESVKQKSKCTCLKRYGCEYSMQSKDVILRVQKTKYKRHTFNTSSEEKKLLTLLESKFSRVDYQYTSKLYPFACDFYIPELDLYIEYQGHWSHGKHPYTGTEEDNIILNKWKAKGTKYYLSAIDVWTRRDIIKRNTAKQNNLKWVEFFDFDTASNYINNL